MSLEGGSNVTGPKLKLHGKESETKSEETNAKARKRSQKWVTTQNLTSVASFFPSSIHKSRMPFEDGAYEE
ncbi:Oidioi.mRNA.OKI2018_I69.PAR.g11987.t1.cds [Oikopleura dioica]|uniref:Oidioi.mRNA.OKI2018_I69.PAR.g11987.t1.cds n=1 Tax=Oikopleura dioica TaxID=34765 RepID=A0ABN7S1A4_OIKDI|nr:Oidioi.mRNA.OKI2018_I69.PAR.g11987.t1.cds [Oikopleura dioica]